MSTSTQQAYANRIFNAAISGNDMNEGLPENIAKFMVEQSAHETNGWTSNFFVNNNNCFGYSCDGGSKWQNGCSSGLADNGVKVGNYDTIEDSTQEIVDWIYRRVKEGKFPSDLTSITTSDQYATMLKNAGYYGASKDVYANGLARWANTLSDFFRKR